METTETARVLWQLYRHYKNGFLYQEGGLMDQPAVYLEAMAFCDQKAIQYETEIHDKKLEKLNKGNGNSN